MDAKSKEFAVINEISENNGSDQRSIASKVGISLGITNIIIKRLISKGYVMAKQLNKRKIQYLLTPKGFSEKADKSYKFVLKTVNLLKSIREGIYDIVSVEAQNGVGKLVVSGQGELLEIAKMSLDKLFKKNPALVIEYAKKNSEKLLVEVFQKNGKNKCLDIISCLSEKGLFYW